MYEENRNQGFDGNGNPDNHRPDETAPNFIMTEPKHEETREQSQNQDQVPGTSRPQSQFQNNMYGGQPQGQPQGGTYHNQQAMHYGPSPYQSADSTGAWGTEESKKAQWYGQKSGRDHGSGLVVRHGFRRNHGWG